MRPAPPASAGRHRCATIRRPISSFPGPVQQQLVHACLLSSLLSEDRRPIDTLPLAVPRCKVPQSRMASATEINQSQTTRPAYLRVASTLRLPTGYRHDLFTHHPHRIPRHRLRTFDADRNTANTPVDAHRLAARRDNTTHHAHPLRQTLQAPTRAHRGARFHSLHLDQRHPAGATSHAVASTLKRPCVNVMRRRDAFTRALHVSTVRFPRAIQLAFQTIPQCKYSPGKVAFESLFGEAISAFDSKFGKKIGDEGQKCFCLVFFFGRFWKIQK